MTTSRYEKVQTEVGAFEAYCALPDGGSGPGILVYQEIFGINDNMRGLADKLAGEGYVALVPDVFWRLEPRFERKDESGFGDAIAMVQRYDLSTAAADILAAHAHLKALAECTGKVGATGFCLGGTLAYVAAATAPLDAAVSYYGSGVHEQLGLLDSIGCPILFQYGDTDAFIPTDQIDRVEAAIADRPGMSIRRYDAGHAFSNWDAPSMYDEAAATAAWDVTLAFFAEHLATS